MTRLSAFCESLTREMLEAYENDGIALGVEYGNDAARAVATRRVRELVEEVWDTARDAQRLKDAGQKHMGPTAYLDEPAPTAP